MNERIKKLAFEAMSINQTVSDDSFFVEVSKLKEFEKFAELIVGECAQAIVNDSRLNDVRSAANGCVRTIREHFGVEE
jgi:hypothetical protein